MHFGNFRKKSVKIGKDRKFKKVSDAFRKTQGVFRQRSSSLRPLSECTRRFPEGIRFFYQISDLYRVVTEIAEVHATSHEKFLKCIIPVLP